MAEKKIQCIRPGLLVQLHVRIEGGRSYETAGIEEEHDGKVVIAKWQTTRRIEDEEEWKLAEQVRGKARNTIGRKCVQTAFGLLCPTEREPELWAALAEARAIAKEFNDMATYSEVKVSMLPGRIAENETAAAQAIAGEMAVLIDRVEEGIKTCSAESVRDSVKEIQKLATMLDEQSKKKANAAIDAARQAARTIVKSLKAGELPEKIVQGLAWETQTVNTARFQFLDLEAEAAELVAEEHAMPLADMQRMAELETDEPAEPPILPEASPRDMDLD